MNGMESHSGGKEGIKKAWPVYIEPVFNGYTDFNLTPMSSTPLNQGKIVLPMRDSSRFVLPYK